MCLFFEQVGHLLRRVYQMYVAIFQNVIPDSRLAGAQLCVLSALNDNGPLAETELCCVTGLPAK